MTKTALKHHLEYLLVRFAALVLRILPRETALKTGGRLGILAGMLLPKRRRLAKENLRRAFPEWTRRRVRAMTWANFQHIGYCGAEMLRLDLFRRGGDDLERYFDMVGMEHIEKALELGRGAILLTGHLGFWEAGFYTFPALGLPVDGVTKPLKNPLTDRYFKNLRESFGAGTLDSRHGARKILKALKQNRLIAILLDQHISPPGSVPTEFFGRLAYTTTAITNMAMKHQIPIIPTFCLRTEGFRYRISAAPPLLLEGEGEDAVIRNTQLLTDLIEQAVRQDPSQWFWVHKRWRVPRQFAGRHGIMRG